MKLLMFLLAEIIFLLLLHISVEASTMLRALLLSREDEATIPRALIEEIDPPTCTIDVGKDYVDNDFANFQAPKAEDCCTICKNNPPCAAWSWNSFNQGTCWLKKAKGNTVVDSSVTSGTIPPVNPPNCPLTKNFDYLGNDIGRAKSTIPEGCCDLCNKNSECHAFSWTAFEGGTCWLKSRKGSVAINPAVQSAEVSPPDMDCTLQYGVDFFDHDIGNAHSSTPGGCCSICHQRKDCNAFSWTSLNDGTCWLKSRKGDTVPNSNVVSCEVNVIPEPTCTYDNGFDYVDQDIGNAPGSDVKSCCDQCSRSDKCKAFSWSNFNSGTCWFKGGIGNKIVNPNVNSGFK